MKNEECGTNTRIVETRSVENFVFSAGSRFPWLIEQKAMSRVTQSRVTQRLQHSFCSFGEFWKLCGRFVGKSNVGLIMFCYYAM